MNASAREVVVTGRGAVSPYGIGCGALWAGVSQGQSGVRAIESLGQLDPELYPVRYGAEVQRFQVDEQLKRHCEVRDEKSVQMGLVAAQQALGEARLLDQSDCVADAGRGLSVIVGSGHGPCNEVAICYGAFYQRGPRAVRPTSVPKGMYNSLSSNLSIYFGVTGKNEVIATACASGTAAIGHGLILIRHGYADIVLCGGADAPITLPTLTGWTNMRCPGAARRSAKGIPTLRCQAKRDGARRRGGDGRARIAGECRAAGRAAPCGYSVTAPRATPTISRLPARWDRRPPCGIVWPTRDWRWNRWII